MQEFLQNFPRAVLVVDSALEICGYSRKTFSVFGLRFRDHADEPEQSLRKVLVDERRWVMNWRWLRPDWLGPVTRIASLGRRGDASTRSQSTRVKMRLF